MAKRIINGKSYNTETATRIASMDFSDDYPDKFESLYQNRFGIYFKNFGGFDDFGIWRDDIKDLAPAEAKDWLIKNASADVVERFFGPQPEAGERSTQISLRIPDALKRQIEGTAKKENVSLNSWIMRCLENAVPMTTIQKNEHHPLSQNEKPPPASSKRKSADQRHLR